MAVIICKTCGGKVASMLATCPHCGAPVANTTTPPPAPAPTPTPSAPQNMVNGIATKCSNCNKPFDEDDYATDRSYAKCKACGTLTWSDFSKMDKDLGVNKERIFTPDVEVGKFHERCLNKLMEFAPADIFSGMRELSAKVKYVWIAQYSSSYVPMDSFSEKAFRVIKGGEGGAITQEQFEAWFPYIKMQTFTKALTEDGEYVHREWTDEECMYRITRTSVTKKADRYFCVPIFEETFGYGDKAYTFYAPATSTNTGCFYEEVPTDAVLTGKPKYVNFLLFTIILGIIVALIAIGIIWGTIANCGLIWGIIVLIIAGFILYIPVAFVGGIIFGVVFGVDKAIGAAIDAKRRRAYKARYRAIQDRKVSEAKDLFNVDLTYEVPNF